MKRAILPIGLQCAGKSTFCEKVIAQFPHVAYISRDKILTEMFGSPYLNHYDGGHFVGMERLWKEVECALAQPELTLILDTWNAPPSDRVPIAAKLKEYGVAHLEAWHFITPLETCLEWSFVRHPMVMRNKWSEIGRKMRIDDYSRQHRAFLSLTPEKEGLFDSVKRVDATRPVPHNILSI